MMRDNVLYHLPIAVANAKHVGSFVRLADDSAMWLCAIVGECIGDDVLV
jgi:hypothetical protein